MAQPGQQFVHICRSCRQTLRNSSWSKSTRAFSITPSRRKVIPSFAPTSNPEFNELLLTWRQKVFMPAAIEKHHRDLMYKTSRNPTLVEEPGVTVTMDDGEEIKLEPMHSYDKPNVHKSMTKLVRYLDGNHNDTDWDNVPPFLRGLVMAKVKFPRQFVPMLTRKACDVGKEQIIIQCAEKSDETGISFKHIEVARDMMLGLHDRAALADFQGPELEAISRRAELVARMLEDEKHGGGNLEKGQLDARTDPIVLAVLLELAAEKAMHKYDGKDQEGKVANYAIKLLRLEGRKPIPNLENGTEFEQNFALWELIPIQNSLEWALKIDSIKESDLGRELQVEMERLTRVITSTVQSLREKVGDKPRRALRMYDLLNGRNPANAQSQGEGARNQVPSASPPEVGKDQEQL